MTSSPPIFDEPSRDSNGTDFSRDVTIGTAIGVGVCVLLASLLVLLTVPPTPPGTGRGRIGDGFGQGTGSGDGVNTGFVSGDSDDFAVGNATGMDDARVSDDSSDKPGEGAREPTEQKLNDAPVAEVAVKTELAVRDQNQEKLKFSLNPIVAVPDRPPAKAAPKRASRRTEDSVGSTAGLFEGRGAESRQKLVEEEGGSAASEAAVELGLKWLAAHQAIDGHWSLHAFQTPQCGAGCAHPGTHSDTAGTALGVLPFLGAGYTHKKGPYKKQVESAISWLIQDENKNGSFRNIGGGSMYAQAQATMALCEALALTQDKSLQLPAQSAVDYILAAQDLKGGGWRYAPKQPGDTSVVGWQVIALASARQAGLRVPQNSWEGTVVFLNSVQANKTGAAYGYMPGHGPSLPMTAEGLLCRIYTGWKHSNVGLTQGVGQLLQSMPAQQRNFYYWYYATQVMHHYGDEPWDQWNPAMRELLINLQAQKGHEAGSWSPQGGHDNSGGRVYATSLALLTLEVYYRHKRIY